MHWPVWMFGPRRSGSASFFGISAIVLLGALSASGQQVSVFVSSKAGNRLTPKDLLQFQPQREGRGSAFQINDAVTYQKIDGFGASFQDCLLYTSPSPRD